MRVIAGKHKSRNLKTIQSNTTRPTTDRNKENMFNMIGPYFEGGNVLDLFGGSGALGIEAISRGCDSLITVDQNYQACNVIKENFTSLKLEQCIVYKGDYKQYLNKFIQEGMKFDLIFLDPPYGKGMANNALSLIVEGNLLSNGSCVVVEEDKAVEILSFTCLELYKVVHYGITSLHIFYFNKE